MNTVDTSTSLNTQIDGGVLPPATDVSNPTLEGAATNLPVITQELADLQNDVKTTATSSNTTTLVKKVMDALVTVVQALVDVVTTLLGSNSLGGKQLPTRTTESTASAAANSEMSATVPPDTAKSELVVPANVSTGTSSSADDVTPSKSANISTLQAGQSTKTAPSAFGVIKNDMGEIVVRTLDGYVVRAEGRDEAWSVTGPDGKMTRIWGDPHVKESDGNTWDFLNRSTFKFGNNKATVEVTPHTNGKTLTSRLTIYSGDERVTIGGIDKNKATVIAVSKDGREHDDSLADGITYQRATTAKGESWRSNKTGRVM